MMNAFAAPIIQGNWWHGLKDLKVTSAMNIDKNVDDFKNMLESLPIFLPRENISFMLEF